MKELTENNLLCKLMKVFAFIVMFITPIAVAVTLNNSLYAFYIFIGLIGVELLLTKDKELMPYGIALVVISVCLFLFLFFHVETYIYTYTFGTWLSGLLK